jgi:hypothetical protein
VDIRKIEPMTDKQYYVGGCTALIDAIGQAIHHIGHVHKYAREEDRPEHTIFVITTDRMEHASHLYTSDEVKAMVKKEQEKYGWEFLFLGANIDAVGEAGRLGISADRAVTYLADGVGQRKAYEAVGRATCALREMPCGAAPMDATWKEEVEEDTAVRGGKKHHRRGLFHR